MAAQGNSPTEIPPSNDYREKMKRIKESLPPEHQKFFESKNRNLISDLEGRNKKPPIEKIIHPNPISPVDVLYSYLTPGTHDYTTYAKMAVIELNCMYQEDALNERGEAGFDIMLGPYYSLLCLFANSNSMVGQNIVSTLSDYSINLEGIEKTLELVNEEFEEAWAFFSSKSNLQTFEGNERVVLGMAASILLFIGKRLSDASAENYMRARWRALWNTLSTPAPTEMINPPVVNNCIAINTSLASKPKLREATFRIIQGLATTTKEYPFQEMFQVIVKLLEWSEMSHIHFIFTYIFQRNPEVLNFPELQGSERCNLLEAVEYLATLGDDAPFAKIIRRHAEQPKLHSIKFEASGVVARSINAMTNPSASNYVVRNAANYSGLVNRVRKFIEMKNAMGGLNTAINYAETRMRNAAGKRLIQLVTDGLDEGEEDQYEVQRS